MLGTVIESALNAVGVTEERVSRWLGRPCGCRERRDKLDALGYWARRVLSGRTVRAAEHLHGLMDESW